MSMPVIDGLEAVQIQIRDRKHLFPPVRLGHGLVKAIGKQSPIGQARQHIVVGHMFKLPLVLLELGHVGEQRHVLQQFSARIAHRIDRQHLGK